MMTLTVKENGVRVANPSHKGNRISGDQIKQYHPTLLEELGFKKSSMPNFSSLETSKFLVHLLQRLGCEFSSSI